MNVVVISDYGITETAELEDINLDEFLDEEDYQYLVYATGYAKITPYALNHKKILLACGEIEGLDVYLTSQVQDPPLWNGVRVPEKFHYADGEWTMDILIVAKPAYQLVTNGNGTSNKIISLNGGVEDYQLKGGAGRNPYLEEVRYPKIMKGAEITEEINDTIDAHNDYHKHKWDMHTQAFLMGPGKSYYNVWASVL